MVLKHSGLLWAPVHNFFAKCHRSEMIYSVLPRRSMDARAFNQIVKTRLSWSIYSTPFWPCQCLLKWWDESASLRRVWAALHRSENACVYAFSSCSAPVKLEKEPRKSQNWMKSTTSQSLAPRASMLILIPSLISPMTFSSCLSLVEGFAWKYMDLCYRLYLSPEE